MSYSAFVQPDRSAIDLRAAMSGPTARTIAEATSWLGGGILFAATVYLGVAVLFLLD